MPELSHVDGQGRANMVDVADKTDTVRIAQASGRIRMSALAFDRVVNNNHKKGDVIATARIAGIQAAKQCANLIPLCHPLMLSKVAVEFELDAQNNEIIINSLCKLTGKTGVEMEALTAASVAALTIYDMCKAVDKGMVITQLQLMEKTGGKSGDWHAPDQHEANA